VKNNVTRKQEKHLPKTDHHNS